MGGARRLVGPRSGLSGAPWASSVGFGEWRHGHEKGEGCSAVRNQAEHACRVWYRAHSCRYAIGWQQKCRTNWATRTLEESRLSATPQKRVPFATNVKGWRRTIEVNTSMTRNAKEMGTSDAYFRCVHGRSKSQLR